MLLLSTGLPPAGGEGPLPGAEMSVVVSVPRRSYIIAWTDSSAKPTPSTDRNTLQEGPYGETRLLSRGGLRSRVSWSHSPKMPIPDGKICKANPRGLIPAYVGRLHQAGTVVRGDRGGRLFLFLPLLEIGLVQFEGREAHHLKFNAACGAVAAASHVDVTPNSHRSIAIGTKPFAHP